MIEYETRFVNRADKVFGTHHFLANDDNAAITRSATVYASGIGKAYEIWRDDRPIHSVVYQR
jgi:hypothetical protein